MGQVSTELTYAGYNTYRMDPNEELHATMFDVSLYSDIVIQLVTINLPQATTATLNLCWIDGENKRIGSIATEPVSILKRFSDYWKAFSVPENAKRLHWWIKAGSVGFNWACSMATPGTVPRAFDSNMANRIAMMDINGTYTSTVRADQVIVGPDTLTGRVSFLNAQGLYTSKIRGDQVEAGVIESIDSKMYIRLDSPSEIFMEGVDSNLFISPSSPLKVVDKNGKLIGGVMLIDGEVKFVAGALTNMENANSFAKIGTMPNPEDPDVMDEGILFYVNLAAPGDPPIYAPSFYIRADGSNLGNVVDLGLYGKECGVSVYQISPDYPAVSLWAKNSLLKVWRDQVSITIIDPVTFDQSEFSMDNETGEMYLTNTNGTLGIDQSGGPYVVRKNGTKAYL